MTINNIINIENLNLNYSFRHTRGNNFKIKITRKQIMNQLLNNALLLDFIVDSSNININKKIKIGKVNLNINFVNIGMQLKLKILPKEKVGSFMTLNIVN
jgi:hypothetical protein